MNSATSADRSPEEETYVRELSGVLERAALSLSDDHRLVFMLSDVEGMSTEETAQCLNLTQENVKVPTTPGPCQAEKASVLCGGSDRGPVLSVSRSAL